MFAEFGEIESVLLPKNEGSDEHKGYGYVCFKNTDDAEKALEAMNKKKIDEDHLLIVNRHVSKRENDLVTGDSTKIGPIT
jgi:RNA recognition motif-containing protein